MVAAPNISQIRPNKSEQAFFQVVSQIKNGKTSQEAIDTSLSGTLREIASQLYNGYVEQGESGFSKVYNALKLDNALLKKWKPEILDKAQFAGTLLSEVRPQRIEWLWKNHLALGKLAILDGDPGLGKSLLSSDITARVTRGRVMPDGQPGVQGGVIVIMPEDGLEDTIQPRMARAGADLTKVSSLSNIKYTDENGYECERPFSLAEDLGLLEAEIDRVNAKMLIIDPIMSVIGDKNTYKDNEVRSMMAPLKILVERKKVACLLIRHVTKGNSDNALYRGGGSIAFIALCRTGLMVMKDPDIDGRVILTSTKNNIGKMQQGITYTIESDELEGDDRPYVVWGEKSALSTSELMSAPHKNTGNNRQEIIAFIKQQAPNELSIPEIAEAMPDITQNNIAVILSRLVKSGDIQKSERGKYHV